MTRWILAFDAGCSSCRDVVEHVQAVAGTQLEVGHLADPEIHQLRHQAMGERISWVPTLMAVEGDKIHAWTGARLSARLARLLGPARSWRLARSISEAVTIPSPGRRTLLKAVPAAAVGAFLVSGGTAFANGKEADTDFDDVRMLDSAARKDLAEQADRTADFTRLREHLEECGYQGEQATAVEARKEDRLVRTVLAIDYRVADDRSADLVYVIDSMGVTSSYARIKNGTDVRVMVVRNDVVTEYERDAAALQRGCSICRVLCSIGVCQIGCGAACGVTCGGNPACFVICFPICNGICEGTGCAVNPCRPWC